MPSKVPVVAIAFLAVASLVAQAKRLENCVQVDEDPERIVCVCNAHRCDEFKYASAQYPHTGSAHLITSSKQGDRFRLTRGLQVERACEANSSSSSSGGEADDENENSLDGAPRRRRIRVELGQKFQNILGWGGAFTDSAVHNIDALGQVSGHRLLAAYFGDTGLKYNFGRVPIGGCDFSLRPYTYDDLNTQLNETDYEMQNFALQPEDKLKVKLIRRANRIHRLISSTNLKIFGSPWSPPAWMKDNRNLVQGHLLDDSNIYWAYARYLIKAFKQYQTRLGFDLWGATLQNEPVSSLDPNYSFNSLQLPSWQAAKFVANYLGPMLRSNGWHSHNFKFMIGDDNLGFINDWVPEVMADPEASRPFAGLAFHWYNSARKEPYDRLLEVYEKIEHQVEFVLMTEACAGFLKGEEPAVVLGSWRRAELYGIDIIQDLLRHSAGWIDWNLALDLTGGPNWVNNTVDSPIIVNSELDEFYKQPMYYMLAHFTRFFVPNSVRVAVTPRTDKLEDSPMSVAVLDEQTGLLAVNLLNLEEEPIDCEINVTQPDEHKCYLVKGVRLPAKSINTVLLRV